MILVKKRNPYIDALKGLAIALVIWGHTIQCMGIDPTAYSNYIGKFIYLFHMPLFFFLSGYVSQGVMTRKFIPLVKSRLKTLFYPMCIWCGVLFLFNAFLTDIYIYDIAKFLKDLYRILTSGYWFIWVLIYCTFYANVIKHINTNNIALIISVFFVWMLPSRYMVLPYISFWKTMYPFFILGYLFFNYDIFSKLLKFKFITILVASIFLVCLLTCDSSNFMYVKPQLLDIWNSNTHFIGLFKYYGFMILAGLSGIYLSYFAILKLSEDSKLFALLKDVGKYTFAIYMMQGIIFNSFCKHYAINLEYHIAAFFTSLIITHLLYKFSKCISKVKYLNFLVGK